METSDSGVQAVESFLSDLGLGRRKTYNLDYLVVGNGLVLRSRRGRRAEMSPALWPLELEVVGRTGGGRGRVHAELLDSDLVMGVNWHEGRGSPADEIEVFQLFSRLLKKWVGKTTRLLIYRDDVVDLEEFQTRGFTHCPRGPWLVAPDPPDATGMGKAADMIELYSDPMAVEWNFEPRLWVVLQPLIDDLKARGRSARVLEVGCGYGKNVTLLEELGFSTYGIDIAPPAIISCRDLTRHPSRFMVCSIARMPFRAGYFDAVLDVGCLHCLPAALQRPGVTEVARVLRPGGRLFSRFLKPRGQAWLARQRYATSAVGMSRASLQDLLSQHFETSFWQDHEATCAAARLQPPGS